MYAGQCMTNSYQFCKMHDISGQRRTNTITKAYAGLYTLCI